MQAEAQKLQQEQREQRVCGERLWARSPSLRGDGDLRGPRVQCSGAEDADGARGFRGVSGL